MRLIFLAFISLTCWPLAPYAQAQEEQVTESLQYSILDTAHGFYASILVAGEEKLVRVISNKQKEWLFEFYTDGARPVLKFSQDEVSKLRVIADDCPLAIKLDPVSAPKGSAVIQELGVKSTQIFFRDLEYHMGEDPKRPKHPILAALAALTAVYEKEALKFYGKHPSSRHLMTLIKTNEELRQFIQKNADKLPQPNAPIYAARLHGRLEQEAEEAYKALDDYQGEQKVALNSSTMIEKGIYGRNDNYKPVVYKHIYEWRRSCVAIVPPGQDTPVGSGVLIGTRVVKDKKTGKKEKRYLVLTCRHVVFDLDGIEPVLQPKDYTDNMARWYVWIDHEYHEDTEPPVQPIRCRVEGYIHRGGNLDGKTAPLDFALLEITPPAGEDMPKGASMPNPLPLTQVGALRWDPLVIIGFPQRQPQWVHDNSWVILPYSRHKTLMNELTQQIINDFLDEKAIKGQADTRAKTFIDKHYLPHPKEKDMFLFIDSWREYGNDIRVHAIAVESDTFRGNSGSPAINRLKGHVVGILQRGQPDGNVRVESEIRKPDNFYKPGATVHEDLLPMEAILRQLDDEDPQIGLPCWRTTYQVKVIKP